MAIVAAAIALLLSTAQDSGSGEIRGPRGVIRWRGTTRSSSDLVTGETKLESNGGLVTVEDTSTGTTLQAEKMTCVLKKDGEGNTLIYSAQLSQNAVVIFDTEVTDQTKAAIAKSRNEPPPVDSGEKSKTVIKSNVIDYRTVNEESHLTFPGPLTVESKSSGTALHTVKQKEQSFAYTQSVNLAGGGGDLVFVLPPPKAQDAAVTPKTAHLAGKVVFHMVRNEVPNPGTQAEPSTRKVDASGDSLDINLVGPGDGTAVLVGNVSLHGEEDARTVTFSGTKGTVIFQGQTFLVRRYEVEGDPGHTHVDIPPATKTGKGGGK